MSSKMLYGRPIPVARIVQGISDRALRSISLFGPFLSSADRCRSTEQHPDVRQATIRSRLSRYRTGRGFYILKTVEAYRGCDKADEVQETGPHLFEFSPAGTAFEYYAHSIGARSQSAKTYLEKNFESFEDGGSIRLNWLSLCFLKADTAIMRIEC